MQNIQGYLDVVRDITVLFYQIYKENLCTEQNVTKISKMKVFGKEEADHQKNCHTRKCLVHQSRNFVM